MKIRRGIVFGCGALLLLALLWGGIGAARMAAALPTVAREDGERGGAASEGPVIQEVRIQVQEDMGKERLLFEDYLKGMVIPQYGVSVLSPFNLRGEWNGGEAGLTTFLPERQRGLVTYGIDDYNGDGQPEMLTVLAHSYRKAGYRTAADGTKYRVPADGIEIKLFRVGEDGVAELDAGPSGIGYRDVFSYSATGGFRAYYVPVEGKPMILLAQLWQYQQDGYAQALALDLYEIGEDAVTHVESLCDAGGRVTDQLKSGKTLYDCTGQKEDRAKYEGLYPFVSGRLEAHGVDGNFIQSYYEARTWEEETGTWEARGDIPLKDYLDAAVMDSQMLAAVTIEDIGHNPYVKKAQMYDGLDSRKGLIPLLEDAKETLGDLENLSKVPTTEEVPVETMPETTEEETQDGTLAAGSAGAPPASAPAPAADGAAGDVRPPGGGGADGAQGQPQPSQPSEQGQPQPSQPSEQRQPQPSEQGQPQPSPQGQPEPSPEPSSAQPQP